MRFSGKKHVRLAGHIALIVISAAAAVALSRTGVFEKILETTNGFRVLGSFVAGLFYTSIFTVAPATVAFSEIAKNSGTLSIALIGGLGAVIGDALILIFLRRNITDDTAVELSRSRYRVIRSAERSPLMRAAFALIGAAVIASPLPDELGLALMGISRVKLVWFLPIAFVCNAAGIAVLSLIARQII